MNLKEEIQSEIMNQLNEFVWPQSKLGMNFQLLLADTLKSKFKGIFYVKNKELYRNDKKLFKISPNDSVDSVIKRLEMKVESISESSNETKFSKKQLDVLRKSYSKLNKINPSSPTYDKLIKLLNSLDKDALKQIAFGDIKFVSMLAKNRIKESILEVKSSENKFELGTPAIFDGDSGEVVSNPKNQRVWTPNGRTMVGKGVKGIILYATNTFIVPDWSKTKPFNESVNEAKWMDLWSKHLKWANANKTSNRKDANYPSWATQKKNILFLVKKYGFDETEIKRWTKTWEAMHDRKYGMVEPYEKWIDGKLKESIDESVNEEVEQLDEKLITFSNRKPYGQIVFMAGGAGSGKGFALKNFVDSSSFKVRDVDEMKKAVGELDKLGKISIDTWYKKYAKNLTPENRAHVEEFVIGKGMSISDIANDLKNPNNVASLHMIVAAMGLKDKWLFNILSGKDNPKTLPNLLFDITAKQVSDITKVIKPLIKQGYSPKNIHLIWVLTDYGLAVKQNKSRMRVVPSDIQLTTHEGAAKTIWSILTKAIPSGLNGRIDVILNNREHTIHYTDAKGNTVDGAVKGFKSLPVKPQGGSIFPEKDWKLRLYKWILQNAPDTVNVRKDTDREMDK